MTIKDTAQNAASDAVNRTKTAAKDAAGAARAQFETHAHEAKDGVAEEVHSISSALRHAADEMRRGSPQERTLGQVANTLADVSDTIHDKDLGEMVQATTRFARQNPAVFLGSAAFLGFAAARFAKSSAKDPADYADARGGYGDGAASPAERTHDFYTTAPGAAGGTSRGRS
jgi:ElaB/YqjD/DUF883 family membrane-anchored ribosome-binding protein